MMHDVYNVYLISLLLLKALRLMLANSMMMRNESDILKHDRRVQRRWNALLSSELLQNPQLEETCNQLLGSNPPTPLSKHHDYVFMTLQNFLQYAEIILYIHISSEFDLLAANV